MAPAAVAVLQYSPVHHRFRVSAKKNLEISEIADAGKKSEIEISAALAKGEAHDSWGAGLQHPLPPHTRKFAV